MTPTMNMPNIGIPPLSCLRNSHKTQLPASHKIWHSHSSSCVDPGGISTPKYSSSNLLSRITSNVGKRIAVAHAPQTAHTMPSDAQTNSTSNVGAVAILRGKPPITHPDSQCNGKLQPLAVGSHRHTRIDIKPGPSMGIEPTLRPL